MRALIVLGGTPPSAALLKEHVQRADVSVAADSGLCAFDQAGIWPDLLVGDMDSVPPQVLSRYEERVPEHRLHCIKDDTDGVDALDLMIARGADEIDLLGALGGRLDHALANVMLLTRAHNRGVHARIWDETVCIERVPGELVFDGAVGDTISFLPLGTAYGVTLNGFFYPLTEHTLTCDHPLGVSNVVTQSHAHVMVREGDLICFHYLSAAH